MSIYGKLDYYKDRVNLNDVEDLDKTLVSCREALYATQYALQQCQDLVCGVYGTDKYFSYAPLTEMSWIPEKFHDLKRKDFLECFDKGFMRAEHLRSDIKALLKYRNDNFPGVDEPTWGSKNRPIEHLLDDVFSINEVVRAIIDCEPTDFDVKEYLASYEGKTPTEENVSSDFVDAINNSDYYEEIVEVMDALLEGECEWSDLDDFHSETIEYCYEDFVKEKDYKTILCICQDLEHSYIKQAYGIADYWKEHFPGIALPNPTSYTDRSFNESYGIDLPDDYIFDDERYEEEEEEQIELFESFDRIPVAAHQFEDGRMAYFG